MCALSKAPLIAGMGKGGALRADAVVGGVLEAIRLPHDAELVVRLVSECMATAFGGLPRRTYFESTGVEV